ncbi:MAG: AraC family transcriptional regulator [Gammaproteobacteria bacterium]|nr:AraC family transcriptional regulator [Gammaproteobacteria bacterium]
MTKTFFSLFATVALVSSMAAFAQDAAQMNAEMALAQAMSAEAAESESREQFRSLDQDVQTLKKEVLDLNRDLFLLEEELLFPANSQVAFFISMDVGEYFELDSVNLKIDGKEVANYLYTAREVDALIRGGVHRVHMANLKTGDHELIAIFTGKGPHVRDYRRGATVTIDKGIGAKYLELEITDRVRKQQPEFVIKEWE